jgi:hypothetical protein
MRSPILTANSLSQSILAGGLLSEAELEKGLAACEQVMQDPERFAMTFLVSQVWGRKPGG